MSDVISTPPVNRPLSLEQARIELRNPPTDLDEYILDLIDEATDYIQQITGKALITQARTATFDGFPGGGEPAYLTLEASPVQSVTSISYKDENGDAQTLSAADYVVDAQTLANTRARISLDSDASWPDTPDHGGVVTVVYVAGYGDASDSVPAGLKAAMRLYIKQRFFAEEKESATIEEAIRNLCSNFLVTTL